jgi:hypothetical protein
MLSTFWELLNCEHSLREASMSDKNRICCLERKCFDKVRYHELCDVSLSVLKLYNYDLRHFLENVFLRILT